MTQPSTIKLKVCGMRDVQNMLAVAELQPDFMGFIFYKKSPRYVGDDFEIPVNFPSSISRVGVFVKEETEKIISLVEKYQLDYLQLHGNESVEQVKALKAFGLKIIKVFPVDDDFDFTSTKDYQPYCDFFLFDTKGKYYGGNAQVFNWDLLNRYTLDVPFFLSGGLNPANVTEAFKIIHPKLFALDVNSGVEVSPGVKSIELITQLKRNTKSSKTI